MNSSILTAIESLCDDIATNTNPDENKKRAEAVVSLAFAGVFTPSEYEDEYEDDENEQATAPAISGKVPQAGTRFGYNGIEFVVLGEEQGGVLAVVAERLKRKCLLTRIIATIGAALPCESTSTANTSRNSTKATSSRLFPTSQVTTV